MMGEDQKNKRKGVVLMVCKTGDSNWGQVGRGVDKRTKEGYGQMDLSPTICRKERVCRKKEGNYNTHTVV